MEEVKWFFAEHEARLSSARMAPMSKFVGVETEGAVATIRLDRPPANALTREVSEQLAAAARQVGANDAVRAVVVWGGERIFAAGADIKAMVGFGPDDIEPDVSPLGAACLELEAIPKVTIAAINGFALGGGCELALACDLRYAGDDAQLGQPEILLGIIPGAGGSQRLPRLVGLARARDLVLSGRRVKADEALEIGLVDRVVPAEDAYGAAREDARRFAAGPTKAYAAAKRALAASGGDLASGLAAEREAFVQLFATRDQEEGMRAFLEKREPRFEGR
jgi:enoyl-CoA hydratase/carnithine racemase